MKYINQALDDNAKFYPNYLTNHIASDFKLHLDNGIKRISDNHDRMVEEIAELKGAIEKINLACVSHYGHGVGKILNDEDGKSLCKLLDKLNQEGEE